LLFSMIVSVRVGYWLKDNYSFARIKIRFLL